MFRKTLALCFFLVGAAASHANDALDRMEAIGEEMSQLMFDAMIGEIADSGVDVSKLQALVPDTSWDPAMRDAASCVLDKYEAKIGAAGIDDMLSDIEGMLPKLREGGIAALENTPDMQPKGVTEDEAIAINQSCGMTKLMQENTMSGEFMTEAMKLMGGF